MTSMCTGQDQLSQLPVELLVIVFQHCTDFTSLWSLISTSSRLSSIFNERACEIVSTILNTTVPSPTRVLMQAVFSMQKGLFAYNSLREAQSLGTGYVQYEPLECVSGTSSQLRGFVRLCHHVHVLAHMTIKSCIQRCLDSPLGQRHYPEGFEDPTWTEEQRMLLGFWRFVYWNQLKSNRCKNLLQWSSTDLFVLNTWMPYYDSPAVLGKQAFTALFYIEDIIAPGTPKKSLWEFNTQSFELPRFPKEKEFCWNCKLAPSRRAIIQRWQPDEKFREKTLYELSQEPPREQRLIVPLSPRSRRRMWNHGDSSSSSDVLSSSQDEEYIPESSSGSSSGEDIDPQTGSPSYLVPRPTPSTCCILRSGSSSSSEASPEEDTDTQYQSILRRRFRSWVPRPVQDFGPQSIKEHEALDLGRQPLGLQFWRSMSLNPEGGPAKYMWFEGYIRYGFALWEEKRMVDMGLWSDGAIEDMSEYYQRWYRFLGPEDISRYKMKTSFRFPDDEDYE